MTLEIPENFIQDIVSNPILVITRDEEIISNMLLKSSSSQPGISFSSGIMSFPGVPDMFRYHDIGQLKKIIEARKDVFEKIMLFLDTAIYSPKDPRQDKWTIIEQRFNADCNVKMLMFNARHFKIRFCIFSEHLFRMNLSHRKQLQGIIFCPPFQFDLKLLEQYVPFMKSCDLMTVFHSLGEMNVALYIDLMNERVYYMSIKEHC